MVLKIVKPEGSLRTIEPAGNAHVIRRQLLGDGVPEVSHKQRQVPGRNDGALAKILGMAGRSSARLPIFRQRIRASLAYID